MSEHLIHHVSLLLCIPCCLVQKKGGGSGERAEDTVSSMSTSKQSPYLHTKGRCHKEKRGCTSRPKWSSGKVAASMRSLIEVSRQKGESGNDWELCHG
jgi:hypothetical protein